MSLADLLTKPIGQAGAEFYRFLESDAVLGQIEARLPDAVKGQSLRLVSMAKSHFTRRAKGEKAFAGCTCKSLVEAICEAAEFGFGLDGRHCYAVPYGQQAQFMPSYIGMLAVAKRNGLIQDAWARVVMPQDTLALAERDGVQVYEWTPDVDTPRDFAHCRGVLAVVYTQGRARWEWMTPAEVSKIRERSRAANSGPWVTDAEEMAKKTVLRRILKTFSDDPAMARLLERDDAASDFQDLLAKPVRSGRQRAVGDVFGGAYLPSEPEPAPVEQHAQEASDGRRK